MIINAKDWTACYEEIKAFVSDNYISRKEVERDYVRKELIEGLLGKQNPFCPTITSTGCVSDLDIVDAVNSIINVVKDLQERVK